MQENINGGKYSLKLKKEMQVSDCHKAYLCLLCSLVLNPARQTLSFVKKKTEIKGY